MAKIAEMTQLSPTMESGKIVKWLKSKGDSVGPGEILAEVETDKAVMEMEAFDEGILLEIVAEEGSQLPVGTPVAIIGKEGEDVSSLLEDLKKKVSEAKQSSGSSQSASQESPPKEAAPKPQPKQEESVSPEPPRPQSSTPAPKQTSEPEDKPRSVNKTAAALLTEQNGRIIASPLAKRIAKDKGIDLTRIPGSGPGGRIVKQDVLQFAESKSVSPAMVARPELTEKKLEISGMRRTIASRLAQSKKNIPHYYLNLEFNAEPLMALRKQVNSDLASASSEEEKPWKLSVNDFLIKASALALLKVPEVNSSWREDHILQHGRVDIGVAVAIEGGLITPYIRNADRLSLMQISQSAKSLAKRAKERKLKPEEYTDGTFTISNLGMFGITHFSAVINEPEAAILAIGGLQEKPIVKDGTVVPGQTIEVTLSCDHRVVDGAMGAQFLDEFRKIVEHPSRLLL